MTRTTQPPRRLLPIPPQVAIAAMAIIVAVTAGAAIYTLAQPTPIVVELAPGETANGVDSFTYHTGGTTKPV